MPDVKSPRDVSKSLPSPEHSPHDFERDKPNQTSKPGLTEQKAAGLNENNLLALGTTDTPDEHMSQWFGGLEEALRLNREKQQADNLDLFNNLPYDKKDKREREKELRNDVKSIIKPIFDKFMQFHYFNTESKAKRSEMFSDDANAGSSMLNTADKSKDITYRNTYYNSITNDVHRLLRSGERPEEISKLLEKEE